jgi:hypothetical protein
MDDNKSTYHELVYCGNCRLRTHPIIIANEDFVHKEPIIAIQPVYSSDGTVLIREEEVINGFNIYVHENKLLKCATTGCNKTFLATTINLDGQTSNPLVLPKEQSWQRKSKFEDETKLPSKPFLLYNEALNAFNQDMRYSCGFLLGSIIESICVQEKIKERKQIEQENKNAKQIKDIEKNIGKIVEKNLQIDDLKNKLNELQLKAVTEISDKSTKFEIVLRYILAFIGIKQSNKNQKQINSKEEIIIAKEIADIEIQIQKAIQQNTQIKDLKDKIKEIESKKTIINLETLVNILIHEKQLSSSYGKLAHNLRDFRNETTHDIYIPKRDELVTSLTMIEELLDEIYIKSVRIDTLNTKMVSFKKDRRLQ